MIENRNGTSKQKRGKKALKNYTQAKQRIANEKKKKSRTGRNGKTEAVKSCV